MSAETSQATQPQASEADSVKPALPGPEKKIVKKRKISQADFASNPKEWERRLAVGSCTKAVAEEYKKLKSGPNGEQFLADLKKKAEERTKTRRSQTTKEGLKASSAFAVFQGIYKDAYKPIAFKTTVKKEKVAPAVPVTSQ